MLLIVIIFLLISCFILYVRNVHVKLKPFILLYFTVYLKTACCFHTNISVGENQCDEGVSGMETTVNEGAMDGYNNTEWENWRERRRQKWMEGGLAGVGRGMLSDHCKEGGVGQVFHQLQP